MRRELAKLSSVQEEQQEQMATKADAASTLQAHTAHVQQTQQTFAQLKAHGIQPNALTYGQYTQAIAEESSAFG